MPPIEKGKEPANIKKRLDTLFAKLDSAYPDKVISGLQKDHKHWAETVTELYRLLGYPDSETFLNAYGYTVKRAAAGRPKGNSEDIIEELKRRYPDGIPFSKISEIAEANPDLKATLKTIQNNANKLYGMSFRDYLTQLGLLNQGKKKSQAERLNHRKIKEEPIILTEEQYLELLKQRYADKENLPRDITQLCAENPDIPVRKLNKYLRKNGEPEAKHYYIRNHILQGKDTDTLEYDYCMVSFAHTVPGVGEKLFAYLPGENTYVPGDMVVAPFGWHGQVMGQVIEVIHCFGIDAPWPVAQTNRILRKAEPEEIANGKLSATQEVSETYVGNQSSKPQSAPVRKAPDWELEAAGDADNGIPENFVPADPRVFERKSQEDLRNKEWECCQFRFRGLRPEIRKLNRYLKENGSRDYTVSQVSDTVWEIRDCLGQKTMEAIEKFPALKVTGLAEHWWRQEVWVIYSESGYSGITNMDLGGYFDRRHDGGDGRWEWEYDMMEPVHVSFTWLQTGEDQEIYYRYPFAAIWDQDSYVREENGCIYVPRVEPEKEFEVENGRLMAYRGNGGDVVIPDTVREICTDTEPFSGNLLITSVRVPGSVKSISSGMFSGCKNLKRVILEEGLEVIERNAFSECTALSEIQFPTSLRHIDDFAFSRCGSLDMEALTLHERIHIGSHAFFGCKNVPDFLLSLDGKRLLAYACENEAFVTVPDSVTEVCGDAFAYHKEIKTVTLPAGLKVIGENAFLYCVALQAINLPKTLERIGKSAFYNCNVLKEIRIPGSVKTVSDFLLYGCDSLETVIIEEGITQIGEAVFDGCKNLKALHIPQSIAKKIGRGIIPKCKNLVIYGKPGSYAEIFAKEKKLPFVEE